MLFRVGRVPGRPAAGAQQSTLKGKTIAEADGELIRQGDPASFEGLLDGVLQVREFERECLRDLREVTEILHASVRDTQRDDASVFSATTFSGGKACRIGAGASRLEGHSISIARASLRRKNRHRPGWETAHRRWSHRIRRAHRDIHLGRGLERPQRLQRRSQPHRQACPKSRWGRWLPQPLRDRDRRPCKSRSNAATGVLKREVEGNTGVRHAKRHSRHGAAAGNVVRRPGNETGNDMWAFAN